MIEDMEGKMRNSLQEVYFSSKSSRSDVSTPPADADDQSLVICPNQKRKTSRKRYDRRLVSASRTK
jgi:hypothetical protein